MSKRPPIDLSALTAMTAGEATTMPEATQRSPMPERSNKKAPLKEESPRSMAADYSAFINFKVSPEFKERYRINAAKAGLKLNELLFEALDAWEAKRK